MPPADGSSPPDPAAPGPPPMPSAPTPLTSQPTLAYRDVHADRKGSTKRFLLQMLGGFAVALVICGVCFAGLFGVGALLSNESGSSRLSPPHVALAWFSLAVVTGVLVGVVWWAIRAYR